MSGHKRKNDTVSSPQEFDVALRQTTTLGIWLPALLAVCVTSAFFLPTETAADSGSDLLRIVLIFVCGGISFWSVGRSRAPSEMADSSRDSSGGTWNRVDCCVLGFIALHTVSCLYGVLGGRCEPRPALNLMWQQLSLGMIYAVTRVSLQATRQQKILLLTIVAGALVVCVYAWYQYGVELPELHQSYLNAPAQQQVQMLLEAGVSNPEPGSRMRQLFESRLFNREPFAYFTLANSLAGLMVPFVLLTFTLLWHDLLWRRWMRSLVWFLPWLALMSTLTLTSSRTGILTVSILMAGVVVWNSLGRESSRRFGWAMATAALLVPVAAVAILWAVGASDGRLISSAPASLRYRLEYWISSIQMVFDYPWLGCGPGSFQACYAKYQLPTASETVSDPHNFVIEWLATAGAPAAGSAVAAIVLVLVGIAKQKSAWTASVQQSDTLVNRESDDVVVRTPVWVLIGSLLLGSGLGVVSGWLFGFSLNAPLALMAGLLVAGLWLLLAVKSKAVPAEDKNATQELGQAVKLAWLGLMLHLSISGGINYPAIGQLFFLGLAIVVNQLELHDVCASRGRLGGRSLSKTVAVLSLVLAGYVYYFQLQPLVKAGSLLSRVESSRQMRQLDGAGGLLRHVLKVDPYNSEAAFRLATEGLVVLLSDFDNESARKNTERQIEAAVSLEPYSSPARTAIADRYLGLVELEQDSPSPRKQVLDYLLGQADQWLDSASFRKPVDASLLARRSWLKWELGQRRLARELAQQAIAIDTQVPHPDLKLESSTFRVPRRFSGEATEKGWPIDSESGQVNAKLWILWVQEQPE